MTDAHTTLGGMRATEVRATMSRDRADARSATERLRSRLRLNAAFSVLSGLATIALAGWVGDQLGTGRIGLVRIAGAALVAYGLDLVITARLRWSRLMPAATAVVAADALWVVGTVVVLATGAVDRAGGRALLIATGVIVLELALVQASALRSARRDPSAPDRLT